MLKLKNFFEIIENKLPKMTDNKDEEEILKEIISKVKTASDQGDKEIPTTKGEEKILEELKDDSHHVRKISNHTINYSDKLQERTSLGFAIVLAMYIIAFAIGVLFIIFSLRFAGSADDPNDYLTTFFGIAGIGDLGYLLYVPAKKIQESRKNASQLLAAFMEWQFISIWSGKLLGKMYKEYNSCNDKEKMFEKITSLLETKVELTKELVNMMNISVEDLKPKEKPKTKVDFVKYLENDKKNLSKATGTAEDELDYSGWNITKQQKDFVFGEDKGKGPAKHFWASKHVDVELEKEPSEEKIKEECKKTSKPTEPKDQCTEGSDVDKRWTQWSLFKHEKEDKWLLRCFNNIQWKCIKKPSQVSSKND